MQVELVRNLVAHSDEREGKWRGKWRMEWVASTLTPPPNVVYPALLKLMLTPRLPAVDWTDAPHRFKWTRPFQGKTKSGFCACAITFRTSYTYSVERRGKDWAVCKILEFQSRTLCRINTSSVDNPFRRFQDGVACLASLDIAFNSVSHDLLRTNNIRGSSSGKSRSRCVLVTKLLDGFIQNLVMAICIKICSATFSSIHVSSVYLSELYTVSDMIP